MAMQDAKPGSFSGGYDVLATAPLRHLLVVDGIIIIIII